MTQHDGNGARSTPGGYLLALEVLDYAPATLTHREKLLLVVLADDANSQTRITYSSVQDPKILRRAKLTRSQLYEVLKGLVAKGVLKKITHGQQHATAKYMILPLGPNQCPGNRDSEKQAQCPGNRDSDESQSPGMAESESRNGRVSVQETGTPTFSTVSTASTTSSRKRDDSKQQQPKPSKTAPAAGPIPGDEPHLADVEAICDHLADVIQKATGDRPKITKREWRDPARLMLDADGHTLEKVLTAIDWAHADDWWAGVITSPKVLRKNYMTLRQKAVAERRRRRGPYQNPADQSVYDEDPTDNSNTQDDYEGDLI